MNLNINFNAIHPTNILDKNLLLSINSIQSRYINSTTIQFRFDKQLARYIAGEYFHRRLFPWNVCEGVLHLDEVVKSEGCSKKESEDDHAVAHIPRFLCRWSGFQLERELGEEEEHLETDAHDQDDAEEGEVGLGGKRSRGRVLDGLQGSRSCSDPTSDFNWGRKWSMYRAWLKTVLRPSMQNSRNLGTCFFNLPGLAGISRQIGTKLRD